MSVISDSRHSADVKVVHQRIYSDVMSELFLAHGSSGTSEQLSQTVARAVVDYADSGEADASRLFRYAIKCGKAQMRSDRKPRRTAVMPRDRKMP
jgi:hypothetical protein